MGSGDGGMERLGLWVLGFGFTVWGLGLGFQIYSDM